MLPICQKVVHKKPATVIEDTPRNLSSLSSEEFRIGKKTLIFSWGVKRGCDGFPLGSVVQGRDFRVGVDWVHYTEGEKADIFPEAEFIANIRACASKSDNFPFRKR